MFYEDFSNPKFISDKRKDTWMFPYIDNFYLLNNENYFYESRLIRLNNKITGEELSNLKLLVVIPSSTTLLKSNEDLILTFYPDNVEENSVTFKRTSPLLYKKGSYDYYNLDFEGSVSLENKVTQYKILLKKPVNSIKIYGI